MGNACVAGGGTPHKIDIVIVNNTKNRLELDQGQSCGRECQHQGLLVNEGKIVEGLEPPSAIEPFNKGTFSASGRDGSAVAPKGKVFYVNKDNNLQVIIEWSHAGWTSRTNSTADATVIGVKEGSMLKSNKPWSELLEVKVNSDSWMYILQEKDGKFDQAIGAAKDLSNNIKNARMF